MLFRAHGRQHKGNLQFKEGKNSDPQDQRRMLGKAARTSPFGGSRKPAIEVVVVMEVGGPDGARRSAVGGVFNQW